ncbi:hypothetical protein CEP53_004597, partial [Fusarium sp. AF-6]
MAHDQADDDYVLGRDISDSIRHGCSLLDAQHLLWKLHNRYTLHPAIPKSDHMKIAEVGTGTGIWLFDLAQDLPHQAAPARSGRFQNTGDENFF